MNEGNYCFLRQGHRNSVGLVSNSSINTVFRKIVPVFKNYTDIGNNNNNKNIVLIRA